MPAAGEPDASRLNSLIARFGIAPSAIVPVRSGLINKTFIVERAGEPPLVLQSVNEIFSPLVQEDIDAVTRHLIQKGLTTPRLVPTDSGAFWIEDHREVWRMMTFIPGRTHDHVPSPAHAESAGALLARFHGALADLQWTFRARRLGVHDTPRHMNVLRDAVANHAGHRLHGEVSSLAAAIFELFAELRPIPRGRERIVHGDPKISNVVFDGEHGDHAAAMIDLDTVGPMPLAVEIGDAFRSWCSTSSRGEDDDRPEFSLPLFEAAVSGYSSAATSAAATPEEIAAFAGATSTIILELSARFAADALNESYFGWDAERFATRGDHNLLRARGQLALARSLRARRHEAEAIVRRAF